MESDFWGDAEQALGSNGSGGGGGGGGEGSDGGGDDDDAASEGFDPKEAVHAALDRCVEHYFLFFFSCCPLFGVWGFAQFEAVLLSAAADASLR